MLERAIQFIDEHGELIKNQVEYISSTPWASLSSRRDRVSEYSLQKGIIDSTINKITFVLEEADEQATTNKTVFNFVTSVSEYIVGFVRQANTYFNTEKWTKYGLDKADEKALEIDFQDTILDDILKIQEKLRKLSINKTVEDFMVPVHGQNIIPLSMRTRIESRYPNVTEFLKLKKEKLANSNDNK